MDYDIINANETIGQIEVAYKDDSGKCVGVYAIDVPIVDGAFITGDALKQEIIHRAPVWVTERKQDLARASNFDDIKKLVVPLEQKPPQQMANLDPANIEMWAQIEFEQRCATALVKFGLLPTNPTTIPVEKL